MPSCRAMCRAILLSVLRVDGNHFVYEACVPEWRLKADPDAFYVVRARPSSGQDSGLARFDRNYFQIRIVTSQNG